MTTCPPIFNTPWNPSRVSLITISAGMLNKLGYYAEFLRFLVFTSCSFTFYTFYPQPQTLLSGQTHTGPTGLPGPPKWLIKVNPTRLQMLESYLSRLASKIIVPALPSAVNIITPCGHSGLLASRQWRSHTDPKTDFEYHTVPITPDATNDRIMPSSILDDKQRSLPRPTS